MQQDGNLVTLIHMPEKRHKLSGTYQGTPNFLNWIRRQNATELAKKIGCKPDLVEFWKSGKCTPAKKYIPKLIKASNKHRDVKLTIGKLLNGSK